MADLQELPDGLLAAVRNRLHITWQDDNTDADLTEMIRQGMNYLDNIAGETLDYSVPGEPGRTLLLEYIRYVRDNALDVFENNYQSLLLALQHDRQIARLAARNPDDDTDGDAADDTTDAAGDDTAGNTTDPADDNTTAGNETGGDADDGTKTSVPG